jgi:hypothetical protein
MFQASLSRAAFDTATSPAVFQFGDEDHCAVPRGTAS